MYPCQEAAGQPKLEPSMTENERTIGPGAHRPIILWPWLVALAAFALYGLTLNPWVTFSSLPFASQITGWDWHPGPLPWRPTAQYPLFLILTSPLRLLPVEWRVLGLNLFTAACAALTLAILARSVRLLAHDRTRDQRLREGGEFALLSVRAAFLPAAFAVLLLAGQLTFWENAVAATGEMIDLLVFAFLILCLLEFRVSQSERWLNLFTFVYGMGAANNWALIGFFPCFLLALVWIKRAGFFHWRFLLRITGWGVLGLLLYTLIPLRGAIQQDGSFWELLRQKLTEQHIYFIGIPRYFVAIAAVPTLVPLLFAAINWPSSEGEVIAGAHNLTNVLFRLLHLVFLAIGVLMFFDVKLSPSPRNMGLGVLPGAPGFLSFYYLAALSVGYFSGFVLLVFGKDVQIVWVRATGLLRVFNRTVTGLLWVAAIGLPALLFWQSFPHIRDFNNHAVAEFGNEMAKSLPAKPAFVLADDPARLYLAMGASQSLGLPDQYIFLESRSLVHHQYLRFLVDRYPAFRQEIKDPDSLTNEITGWQIGDFLRHLAQRHPVYYLHPSFGRYFERVCMVPYRLGGYLLPYPADALDMMGLSVKDIPANQAYWHTLEKQSLASLPGLAKTNTDALRIANYYSQALDYWGTELQKAGTEFKLPALLEDANNQFAEALRLNSNNAVARINQQYNAHLRNVAPVGPLLDSSTLAANVNNWDSVFNVDGPVDEPYLDIRAGQYFAMHNAYMQAAHLFQRCLELATNNPEGQLDLAKTYIDMGLVDAGLALIRNIREPFTGDPLELVRVEALAYVKTNNFAQADKLLTEGRARHPKDENFPGVMASLYRLIGYRVLAQGSSDPARENEAAQWFKKSLAALEEQLQLLNSPMNVTANALRVPQVNLQKIEMQMMLRDYTNAIVTATAMVRQDPESPRPLLNRAISELQLNRLDAAKKDYQAAEQMTLEPLQKAYLYYGLAQVAQKQNDKQAEIRYSRLYLDYAPRKTAEFTNVTQRLQKLEAR
jgi:tetratricopeptide (TPR) repeat protein